MPKHTPGPWSRNIKPAAKYNTIFAGRNTHICHLAIGGLTDEEIEANCDLIAAAPDLLEALRGIFKAQLCPEPKTLKAWAQRNILIDGIVRKALNKAKGSNL